MRRFASTDPDLQLEAAFGMQWITKLWNPVRKVLYAQVGIVLDAQLSAGNFAPFNTATAGYEDNVVSWLSVEPADDYTAASLFAFALGGAEGSGLG